jgi:hypothetical protein
MICKQTKHRGEQASNLYMETDLHEGLFDLELYT